VASLIWNAGWLGKAAWASEPLMLASVRAAFFLGQTAPVAGIIKLTEGAALRQVWLTAPHCDSTVAALAFNRLAQETFTHKTVSLVSVLGAGGQPASSTSGLSPSSRRRLRACSIPSRIDVRPWNHSNALKAAGDLKFPHKLDLSFIICESQPELAAQVCSEIVTGSIFWIDQ
jgi:hypothetical protein